MTAGTSAVIAPPPAISLRRHGGTSRACQSRAPRAGSLLPGSRRRSCARPQRGCRVVRVRVPGGQVGVHALSQPRREGHRAATALALEGASLPLPAFALLGSAHLHVGAKTAAALCLRTSPAARLSEGSSCSPISGSHARDPLIVARYLANV